MANRSGFDYHRFLRLALRGDAEAVQKLLEFSVHTDAAASLGHGVILLEVCARHGDTMAAALAVKLDAKARRAAFLTLEAGGNYSSNPKFKDVEVKALLPELWTALQAASSPR